MKTVAGLLMITKAALFFFSGVQHAGVSVGRFHEPHIIPAADRGVPVWALFVVGATALERDSGTTFEASLQHEQWVDESLAEAHPSVDDLRLPVTDGFIDVHRYTSLRILVSAWAR